MDFSHKLTRLRKVEGLSREQLATKLGVSYSTVAKYETGVREPDFNMLEKIADLFNVSSDYLLGRSDKQSSSIERQSEDENLFFFDEENITPEEMEELKKHLEFLRYKAGQENKKTLNKRYK